MTIVKHIKPKIVIMASGQGSNFEALCKASMHNKLYANIIALVGDQAQAFVFARAKKLNIPHYCIDHKKYKKRSEFNRALLDLVSRLNPDYIVLAGFMKVLAKEFVVEFKNKIINIHPSLLPLYPGIHSIERAWNEKQTMTGVSVHFVDEGVDTGKVIMQHKVVIAKNDSLKMLKHKIHQVEHELYVKALNTVFKQDQ